MAKEKAPIKGNIEVEIDERQLEARLVFTPSDDGEAWDEEKIRALLESRQLGKKVEAQKLGQALTAFRSQEGESVSGVVASGTPPQDPVRETVEWPEVEIPEELVQKSVGLYQGASAPAVYDIRVNKVKVEQTVTKKGALPFLKAKQETVVKWKSEEIRKQVDVDPEPVGKGYVGEGTVIATVEPGRPGKPGTDLFGGPVAPERPKKTELYLGNGVVRKGKEVRATVPGFLRRGDHWVDIIPYRAYEIRVYAVTDSPDCLLDFTPGTDDDLPSALDILDQAEGLGFDRAELQSEEDVTSLLIDALSTKTELAAEPLNVAADSLVALEIAPDNMKATLTLRKARGKGRPLELKQIGAAIKEAGLKGMDTARAKADLLAFYKGKQLELTGYLLAEGKPPGRVTGGQVKVLVQFLDEQKAEEVGRRLGDFLGSQGEQVLHDEGESGASTASPPNEAGESALDDTPSEGGLKSADEEAPGAGSEDVRFAVVTKDQKLAEIVSPKEGQAGTDVFGKSVAVPGGDGPRVDTGELVRLDGNSVVAVESGLLVVTRQRETLSLSVQRYRDGEISVRVSEDKMKGWLSLEPSQGAGERITDARISKELEKNGIVKGINSSLVMELVRQALEGEAIPETVVAEGLPPRHGSGSRLHFHVAISSGRALYADTGPSGNAKNEEKKRAVRKDDLLAEILPPAMKSREGWDVAGVSMATSSGPPIDIETGANVRREELEDGTICFRAEKNGEVFYDGNLLDIKDTMVLKRGLTGTQGPIKFSGTVQVEGAVESGSRIFSGGDIKISDTVAAAVLSSDGSIFVGSGIRGGGKAILRSKGNIEATYIEEATLLAVGDIRVKKSCLRCSVKCNSKMQLDQDAGVLLGGAIKAKKGLELRNLGSEAQIRTEISFGQDYLVADQIDLEEREMVKLKSRVVKCDALLKKAETSGSAPKGKIEKVRKEKLLALKIMEKRSVRLFNLREKFEEHFPSEIVVRGDIFPGVVLESHGRFHEITSRKKAVSFFFDSETGRIAEKALEAG